MTSLTSIPTFSGYESFLFFEDNDTEQVFKVFQQTRSNPKGQLVASLSVTPADATTGESLLNPAGEPDTAHSTHVFTEEELSKPDFNGPAVVQLMLIRLIERKKAEIVARQSLSNLDNDLSGLFSG